MKIETVRLALLVAVAIIATFCKKPPTEPQPEDPTQFKPVAIADALITNEDAVKVLLDVLKNDTDPNKDSLEVFEVFSSLNNTVEISADKKKVVYSPKQNFFGPDVFTYVVWDKTWTDTASVIVTVNPINDPPSEELNKEFEVIENVSTSINNTFLKYSDVVDKKFDDEKIIYKVTTVPKGLLTKNGQNFPKDENDTFTQKDVNENRIKYKGNKIELQLGKCSRDPVSDNFFFTVTDDSGGAVSNKQFNIKIMPKNDTPLLSKNGPITVDEGNTGVEPYTIKGANVAEDKQELVFTDKDNCPNQIIYTLKNNGPRFGTLSKMSVRLNPEDTFSQEDIDKERIKYKHDGSEQRVDSFEFTIKDPLTPESGRYIFSININPLNDVPKVAQNETWRIDERKTNPIPSGKLKFIDDETTDSKKITYTLTSTSRLTFGSLRNKDTGQPLNVGSKFTQNDIDNNYVEYQAGNLTETVTTITQFQKFTFVVDDGEGGKTFEQTFKIEIFDKTPPINKGDHAITASKGATVSIGKADLHFEDNITKDDGRISYTITEIDFTKGILKIIVDADDPSTDIPLVVGSQFHQNDIKDNSKSGLKYIRERPNLEGDHYFKFHVRDQLGNQTSGFIFELKVPTTR